MPYNPWIQFRRQRASLGLPIALPLLRQQYSLRPLTHSNWNSYNSYSPAFVPLIVPLPAWMQNNGGVVTIQTAAVPAELLAGVRYYSAMLEGLLPHQPPLFRASAGGAVVHDGTTDRLYYAVSRFLPDLQIHPVLMARLNLLPLVQTAAEPINTRIPNRHAHTCAEFQALNLALADGAHEQDLNVWCFRVTTAEPFWRCPNCRTTVPEESIGRIWTR
jgi:hypothetical protein